MKLKNFLLASVLLISGIAQAEDDLLKNLNYPELEVTPLASEIVIEEAKAEKRRRWTTHIPLQVSAVSTLLAAQMMKSKENLTQSQQDDFDYAKKMGQAVGFGWILTTGILAAQYMPYRSAYSDIKKMSGKSKRDKLARERRSERILREAAQLAKRLKWMSFISNFAASGYMTSNSNKDTELYGAFGVLMAFTPFVFDSRWIMLDEEHQSHKKRIYGPVAHLGWVMTPDRKDMVPGLQVSYSF